MKSVSRLQRAERLLRVGLYDLEKTLGKGNFAIVRLGIHRLTKTRVAIKVVDKNDLDAENLKKISREIEIMRNLSHRHIIQLYQVMETDTFIHIVTECAASGEIFDYLVKNGKMSEKEAAVKFAQILRYDWFLFLSFMHVGINFKGKITHSLVFTQFDIELEPISFWTLSGLSAYRDT